MAPAHGPSYSAVPTSHRCPAWPEAVTTAGAPVLLVNRTGGGEVSPNTHITELPHTQSVTRSYRFCLPNDISGYFPFSPSLFIQNTHTSPPSPNCSLGHKALHDLLSQGADGHPVPPLRRHATYAHRAQLAASGFSMLYSAPYPSTASSCGWNALSGPPCLASSIGLQGQLQCHSFQDTLPSYILQSQ